MLTLDQLQRLTLDPDAIKRVPESIARAHCVLPIGFADGELSLVLPSDHDELICDSLKHALECKLVHVTAERQALWDFVDFFYTAVYSDVRNCAVAFRFKCPKMWINLTATDDPMIRHCGTCDREVHFCATPEQFDQHRNNGNCVSYYDRDTSTTGLPL